jgi:putative flippase GtrA
MSLWRLTVANEETKSPLKLLSFYLAKAARNKEIKHAIKFGLVGLLGTTIDFTIVNLLIFGAGWNSPLGQLYASIVSTSIAITSNFTWNRRWTFRTAQAHHGGLQFVQYVVVALAGLMFNSIIFYFTNQFLYTPFLPDAWAVQLAKVTAIGLVMFWNFGMNRIWTFRGA